MSREQTFQAIVIKKQPFNEADELITLFTQEQGKVRAMAKSVKLGTSKLQQALQPIFLSRITTTASSSLPKVISVQTINTFPGLYADPDRVKVWFVVAELLHKSLADELPNEPLFALAIDYLQFLNTASISEQVLAASLVKFKIQFLELIGLQIHAPATASTSTSTKIRAPRVSGVLMPSGESGMLFSANRGGFYIGPQASDARPVSAATWQAFNTLRSISFAAIRNQTLETSQLQDLVNSFISYQLERDIKAEKFL